MSEGANGRSWAEATPILPWRVAQGGDCVWVGRQWSAYTGLSEADSLEEGWLNALHPDDRAPTLRIFAAALRDSVQCDHRIRAAKGSYRWHRTLATLAGEWNAASLDIDDLHLAVAASARDLAASRRRLRQMLGAVRAVARRTAATSQTLEGFAMHFEGRLDALARAENRIARGDGTVDLGALVAEEVAVFLAREDGRFSLSGPPLRLRADAAAALTLLFHELAANAMKFGALSPRGGRLKVSWGREPESLRIAWIESGVPLRGPPGPDGFGAEWVKQGFARRLRARADFTLRPDGLACTVDIPLEAVAA